MRCRSSHFALYANGPTKAGVMGAQRRRSQMHVIGAHEEERMVITGFLFTNCWLYRIYRWTQFLLELRNLMPWTAHLRPVLSSSSRLLRTNGPARSRSAHPLQLLPFLSEAICYYIRQSNVRKKINRGGPLPTQGWSERCLNSLPSSSWL